MTWRRVLFLAKEIITPCYAVQKIITKDQHALNTMGQMMINVVYSQEYEYMKEVNMVWPLFLY
ncbi:hypothetical protein BCT01_02475 [Vibrio tasmaniensis]|nr:hypothetical protein A162_12505 [Vibrio tasmaniensis 1F-155]PMO86629.1 hypothetical protein BCT01_02475 [Vibrio tasmaniensis]